MPTGRSRYYKRKLYFSTRDRILLHLLEYVGREGEFNQPDGLTQFGIADAIALGRSTVSKAIRRLEREKLVAAERAHVPSGKLRRTVYLLTEAGISKANHRRMEVEEEIIAFRDGKGVDRRLRVLQVPRLVAAYASLLDVVAHVSEGVFDATTFHPRRQRFVDLTERVPRLRYFFGRDQELAAMEAWLESPSERVLVITGITGIGKTTLLSRKIEDWRGKRHILFHRIMDWTTLRNVLQQAAEFLTRLGKKELAQYLEAKPAPDLEEVVSILATDLHQVPAVLVYDDYHNAEPPIQKMFYGLRAALEEAEAAKVLVAGRFVPPFYDRRDVRVRATVRELPLGGLDPESSVRILEARNLTLPESEVEAVYRVTRGHPLFLELVDSASLSEAQDVHKYLEEELLARITDAEAKVLTIASVFRNPVHADGLFIDEGIDSATVRGLVEQSLLREVSARVYEVHDALRSFFNDLMTPQERRRYHRWAAQFLLSHPDADPLEALHHLVEADETTNAARLAVKEGRAIVRSGRSEESLRVLQKLLPGVEDPAQSAELRLLKAHILNVRGELDQAVTLYREILKLPPDPPLQEKIAEAHRYMGDILRREGRSPDAEQHLEAALRLFRSLEHGEGQGETLLSTGQLAEDLGDHARAEKLYTRAVEIAHELGTRPLEAHAYFAMSRLLVARGDLEGALEQKGKALAIAEGLADWHLQARFQVSMGANLFELKRYEEAMGAYERGIEIARRIGDLRMLAYGLYNAAGACIRQDDLLRAEAHLKESDGLFRKLREPLMNALLLYYYGTLWERRGKWQLARQHFSNSMVQLRSLGRELDFARTAVRIAPMYHRNGETPTALALLQDALEVARRLRAKGLQDEAQQLFGEFAQGPEQQPVRPSRSAVPEQAHDA